MKSGKWALGDGIFMLVVLVVVFSINLLLQRLFQTQTMIPMIFVLGVFLVSWKTQGYFWGLTASLISVLAVNYAFTYPYWAFDLISPECISSAVVMLIVAIMTGALTTRIKQTEKLKAEAEKERMRGNLLRAVSHDLRTPLTGIYGACSVMIDNFEDISPERQLKLLKDIRSDSQWLVRMVENLLSITRIDSTGVSILKTPTALDELLDAVLLKFHKLCPRQKVILTIPDEIVMIPMDAILMEQVLINLLENAVRHGKNMTRLELGVTVSGSQAIFCIADNGCGISPDRLDNLFDGYFHAGKTPADGQKRNTGIGLSVCATIIRAHGGTITAENRPEGGALFRFTLNTEEFTNE